MDGSQILSSPKTGGGAEGLACQVAWGCVSEYLLHFFPLDRSSPTRFVGQPYERGAPLFVVGHEQDGGVIGKHHSVISMLGPRDARFAEHGMKMESMEEVRETSFLTSWSLAGPAKFRDRQFQAAVLDPACIYQASDERCLTLLRSGGIFWFQSGQCDLQTSLALRTASPCFETRRLDSGGIGQSPHLFLTKAPAHAWMGNGQGRQDSQPLHRPWGRQRSSAAIAPRHAFPFFLRWPHEVTRGGAALGGKGHPSVAESGGCSRELPMSSK